MVESRFAQDSDGQNPNAEQRKISRAVAKEYGLDLDILGVPKTPEHLSISKLGKVPAFESASGFKLFECMAIAIYVTSYNEQTTLLEQNKEESADIVKWVSFINTEIIMPMSQQLLPLIGVLPYDEEQAEFFTKMTQRPVDVVEDHL
ncbi:elongation factor EF-1 gamma subunit [Diatrype stigma]|uniref:Elongation factor EF-1 gamma subunit n=1 Tax=Diatrype stigma TaxID=117547 RepID=A0AAN9UT84_9PEZI